MKMLPPDAAPSDADAPEDAAEAPAEIEEETAAEAEACEVAE